MKTITKTIALLLLTTTIFFTSCKDINTNTEENAISFIKESVSIRLNSNEITFEDFQVGVMKDSTYTTFSYVFTQEGRKSFCCNVKFNKQVKKWSVSKLDIITKYKGYSKTDKIGGEFYFHRLTNKYK